MAPMDRAENPFASMMWRCEICKEQRPDEFIDVLKADLSSKHGLPPGTCTHNIKYCNDTIFCFAGAVKLRQADQGEIEMTANSYAGLRPVGGQYEKSPRLAYYETLLLGRGRINVTNLDYVRTSVHSVY